MESHALDDQPQEVAPAPRSRAAPGRGTRPDRAARATADHELDRRRRSPCRRRTRAEAERRTDCASSTRSRARHVDAEVGDEALRHRRCTAPGCRSTACRRSRGYVRPPCAELVALRVAAEVVVVVEDQDARRGPARCGRRRRRQAADAAADHHQVVALAGRGAVELEPAVPQAMRGLEGAVVAAAQPDQRRRVVAGGPFEAGIGRQRRLAGATAGRQVAPPRPTAERRR